MGSRWHAVAVRSAAAAALACVGLQATAAAPQALASAPSSCPRSQLSITFGTTGITTTRVVAFIVMTNRGRTECSLDGFPTVRYAGDGHRSFGRAAAHDGRSPQVVELRPGRSAHAEFKESVPGEWAPADCRPKAAVGLAVEPPGDRSAQVLRFPGEVCSSPTAIATHVTAVESGPGPAPSPCEPPLISTRLGATRRAGESFDVTIEFSNPVLYTCSLRGRPTVRSVAGAGGAVVGPAATPAPGTVASVWVQPYGGVATSTIGIVDIGAFTSAVCGPRVARGFAVAMPGSRSPVFIAYRHEVCTRLPSTRVAAVVAGTGT